MLVTKTMLSKHLDHKKREKGFCDGILTCTITENNMNNAYFYQGKYALARRDFLLAQHGCYLPSG